jgi:hypothetical protein
MSRCDPVPSGETQEHDLVDLPGGRAAMVVAQFGQIAV